MYYTNATVDWIAIDLDKDMSIRWKSIISTNPIATYAQKYAM